MKIVLVNGRGYAEYGCENYFSSLCRLLKAKGHQVVPFTEKDDRNIDREYGDYCVDKSPLDDLGSAALAEKIAGIPRSIYSAQAREKMSRLIRDLKPDLVHLHNIKRRISPSILDPIKKAGIPVVQTMHDYQLVCPNYRMFTGNRICEKCGNKKYFYAFFKRCVRNSFSLSLLACVEQYLQAYSGIFEKSVDVFIAPSRFLQNKIREHGFKAKKMVYLPNFVFTQDYHPGPGCGEYAVCMGRLVEEKGMDIAVKAMRGFPSVKLLILGGGECRKKLEKIASSGNMANIEFKGYLPPEETKEILGKAIFTIVPSRWYEGCPMVVLESFAMGKPVIGADIGGIRELVDDGVNGFLFPPDDVSALTMRIGELLNDREKTARMGQNARRKAVENYSDQVHYAKLMDLYGSLGG